MISSDILRHTHKEVLRFGKVRHRVKNAYKITCSLNGFERSYFTGPGWVGRTVTKNTTSCFLNAEIKLQWKTNA